MAKYKGVVVALDISSVCVGYSIHEDGRLLKHGRYRLRAKGHGEKLGKFRKWLLRLLRKYNPSDVVIEKPFPKGRISHTYHVLSMYEAIAVDAHFVVLQYEMPAENKIFAHEVKRIMGVKKGANHADNKYIMVQAVNQMFGLSLKYVDKDSKKVKSQDDVADAIALGYAWHQKYYG